MGRLDKDGTIPQQAVGHPSEEIYTKVREALENGELMQQPPVEDSETSSNADEKKQNKGKFSDVLEWKRSPIQTGSITGRKGGIGNWQEVARRLVD